MNLKRWLAIALLVASGAAPAGVAGRDAPWTLLPEGVRAVAHLDMSALGGSALYRLLLEQHGEQVGIASSDYLAFVESTGFDPMKDLETLTIGAGGDAKDAEAPFYAILSGRFDRERIEKWVTASGDVATARFEGLSTFSPAVDVNEGPPPTAAFLDERTLLIASSADFGKLVAAVRGSGRAEHDSSLSRLLSSAEGQLRIAIEVDDERGASGQTVREGSLGAMLDRLESPAMGPLGSVSSVLLTLDARSGLDVAIRAAARSPEAGKLVHDQLAGYLILGRAVSTERPELASLLGRLELEQSGSSVRLSVRLSAEEIEAAIASRKTGSASATGG